MVPSWYENRRKRRGSPDDSNPTQVPTTPRSQGVDRTNASSSSTTSSPRSTSATNTTSKNRNRPSETSSPLTKHTTLANLDEVDPQTSSPQSLSNQSPKYLGPSEPETPQRHPIMRRPREPADPNHLSDPHQNRALPSIPSMSSSSSTSPTAGHPKSEKNDRKISSSTDRSQARSLSYEYEVPPQRPNQGQPLDQTVSVTTLPQPFDYSKPSWDEAPPPPRSRKPYSFSYTQNEFINIQSRLVWFQDSGGSVVLTPIFLYLHSHLSFAHCD